MAYNPSIHTASNKPYGVIGMPVDARYWFYDSDLFEYRAYASTAEVLAYLIGDDRKGATVQIGTIEYWFRDGVADSDLVQKSELGTVQSVNGRTGAVIGLAEQSALQVEISARESSVDGVIDLLTEYWVESISFTYNGSSKTFFLAFTPVKNVLCFLDGTPLKYGSEYTTANNILTLSVDLSENVLYYTIEIHYFKK